MEVKDIFESDWTWPTGLLWAGLLSFQMFGCIHLFLFGLFSETYGLTSVLGD